MNTRNEQLRRRVKRVLLTKWGREASDRDVAGKVECSRSVVTSCRMELRAAGLLPDEPLFRVPGHPSHLPGTSARGGYVYDESGRTVREVEWLKRKRARAHPSR